VNRTSSSVIMAVAVGGCVVGLLHVSVDNERGPSMWHSSFKSIHDSSERTAIVCYRQVTRTHHFSEVLNLVLTLLLRAATATN
jgi:hypothetical protein